MLAAIAKALPVGTFANALANDPGTTAVELPVAWLDHWKVYELQNTVRHPQRLLVALSSDGRALLLSGMPDAFVTLSKTAPVREDAAALVRGQQFLELSRPMGTLSYEVSSSDAIRWLPHPTDAERTKIAALRTELGSVVTPPTAQVQGDGWAVTLWRINDDSLERHVVFVAASGELTDRVEVVRTKLPVVIGI